MYFTRNLSVYPSRVVDWVQIHECNRRDRNVSGLLANKPQAAGSRKANKRLQTALSWLLYLAKEQEVNDGRLAKKFKFKINFLTLTLPSNQIKCYQLPCGKKIILENYFKQVPAANIGFGKFIYNYSDHFVKKELLNHFCIVLRQKYKVSNYVWKAETQANGNIHIHITLNKYIFHEDLRAIWNRILSKTDLIQKYHDKFCQMDMNDYYIYRNKFKPVSWKKCVVAFERGKREDWSNPNSIDVHSVRDVRNVESYLTKYMTKVDTSRRFVVGYLWRLSESLSKFKCALIVESTKSIYEFNWLINNFKEKFLHCKHADLLYMSIHDIFYNIKNSKIVQYFSEYVENILNPKQILITESPPIAIPVTPNKVSPLYFQSNISF
jgi:hypothetical protein